MRVVVSSVFGALIAASMRAGNTIAIAVSMSVRNRLCAPVLVGVVFRDRRYLLDVANEVALGRERAINDQVKRVVPLGKGLAREDALAPRDSGWKKVGQVPSIRGGFVSACLSI